MNRTTSSSGRRDQTGVASGSEQRTTVDIRDMLVVHTALLREFRLVSVAVADAPRGDARRAAVVERHLEFLCGLLHHHHTGEDTHLWPPLRKKLPEHALHLIDEAEAQHGAIDEAMTRANAARRTWTTQLDETSRNNLVEALQEQHRLLSAHLDAEERTLLPLAAAHLTEPEWGAIGAAAVAAIPKKELSLVFGMFAYEGDPEVLRMMLQSAPPPVRILMPRIAPRAYARRATEVYNNPRP